MGVVDPTPTPADPSPMRGGRTLQYAQVLLNGMSYGRRR